MRHSPAAPDWQERNSAPVVWKVLAAIFSKELVAALGERPVQSEG
jgi:hypothetical protein